MQPPPEDLVAQLASRARAAGGHGESRVLADRDDGTVVRVGAHVAKAHAAGTDLPALRRRVAVAAHPRLHGILLPPSRSGRPSLLPGGRAGTVWPYGTPVDPGTPDDAPWAAAGALLARLHSVPPAALAGAPGPLPPMRGPAKLARAMTRLRTAPAADGAARRAVEAAFDGLPAWCRDPRGTHPAGPPPRLCHGDFHLGQLVRHPGPAGEWHLIDVDDLGLGDPAWDLARPACWYAAGLLPAAQWQLLLDAYQRVTGDPGADPWPRLDAPARALTAQTAALALAKAAHARRRLDDAEEALVGACARIARTAADRHT
jgi:aminoglycoside phosphotransferase (APT) family kinase protein